MAHIKDASPEMHHALQQLVVALRALGIDMSTAGDPSSAAGGNINDNGASAPGGSAEIVTATDADVVLASDSGSNVLDTQTAGDTTLESDASTEAADAAADTSEAVDATTASNTAAAPVASGSNPSATLTCPVSGVVCMSCNTWNPVPQSGEPPTYVVTVGLQVGVFDNWALVQSLVSGVSGACYRRYSTRAAADAAFANALNNGVVMIVGPAPVTVPAQPPSA